MSSYDASLEQSLLKRIGEVDKAILDLEEEKKILVRLLIKTKKESNPQDSSYRKNSVEKILIETAILEMVNSSNFPVSSTSLLRKCLEINRNLKDSTFRSHVFRLKERGMIKPHSRGYWKAGDGFR